MRRRDIIAWVPFLASAPVHAWSQQSRSRQRRIGILDNSPSWEPFHRQLKDLGEIDGQTIALEYRSGEGDPERLKAAAATLVSVPVDVIAVFGTAAAQAAQGATDKIPIVAISTGIQ